MLCARPRKAASVALGALLVACATSSAVPAPVVDAAYVLAADDGGWVARAIVRPTTSAADCPTLRVDGVDQAMQTRAAPALPPLRPGQGKFVAFPDRVCEARLPAGVQRLALGDLPLPVPAPLVRHLLVIGDTGCRIKATDQAYQDCSDPVAWPFPALADAAAREQPQLVIHVGDYHYRESPCPAGRACVGSPWGYGWDAWEADFFAPARRLLAAAPWVVTRGNHELCARAGQG